jgi:anthranilate synthase/aminodeoxychorismate synthase-like glutamine amidotransferase
MLLLIDNYDSFAHNLARYFVRLGCEVRVERNDAITIDQVRRLAPEAIVLSPGPCTPCEAGISLELVRQLYRSVPILGICLGHQTIVVALGGTIGRCAPMHGRTSLVGHCEDGIFAGIPNPLRACRYHSLVALRDALPGSLLVTGQTDDALVMAVAHRQFPVVGLQFHPEAILTEHGFLLLANFLSIAQVSFPGPLPHACDEWPRATPRTNNGPRAPITF